jgi:hypothetical protein
MTAKLLPWPIKPKRKRRTSEQVMAEHFGMTVAEWRRWQMVRDAKIADGTWNDAERERAYYAIVEQTS